MRVIPALLIFLFLSQANATEGVEIIVFSKTLSLAGNCKYWPATERKPYSTCLSKEEIYTISLFKVEEASIEEVEGVISNKSAKQWKIEILERNSETIEGLTHSALVFVTEDGSIKSQV